MPTFYEFFAGGGMARAGLGTGWTCLFSNDIDAKKAESYIRNWGAAEFRLADVASVDTGHLPGVADLAWASFPCQDLSLAGSYVGLQGKRSGSFWPFWRVVDALAAEGRAPRMVVLENVCGALTSHGGRDFAAIADALSGSGYSFGALVIDAALFLPQSRPRLFVVGVRDSQSIPAHLRLDGPQSPFHTESLLAAHRRLSSRSTDSWIWWRLPEPPLRKSVFADLTEENPGGVSWHSKEQTTRLLAMMSSANRLKVEAAATLRRPVVGAIYKRTRLDELGQRVQRAEVRFDEVAGCLRTPGGGSSRQSVLIVDGKKIRSRLLSPREAARLMGLPDSYQLPENYNAAYHLAGDGVAVPVVRYLADRMLEPLASASAAARREAA